MRYGSEKLRVYYFSITARTCADQFAATRGPGRKVFIQQDDPEKVRRPQVRVYIRWATI